MTTDIWIPRILTLGQLGLIVVCGVLIGLGHNSVITDLFIAAGGSLIGSSIIGKALGKSTTATP